MTIGGFSMKRLTSHKALLLGATMLAGLSASPTLAQTAPAASASNSANAVSLGELVVTASRRATTVQNSPINISAVPAQTIQNLRIADVRSLAAFTPGVTVADTGPASTGNIILR